ncbi:MAG: thermonuclease family protein [Gemmatimonadetes bacterium]|nr:thermonuclease family protein [Gemmatimonadota bacterium]
MGVLARIALCAAALTVAPPALAAEVSGTATVLDGDTVEVASVRVRLHGIDAPETAQTCTAGARRWACGREAKAQLVGLLSGRRVVCDGGDQDRYQRAVAVCWVGDVEVNRWMVSQGWALAYRRYSRAYVGAEAAARAARRGMWQGRFVEPWKWRRGKRLKSVDAADGCRIKGNINGAGSRIYHVPGGRHYERTRIDESKGERWLCSEAEARAAGWRRAQQ